MFPAKLALKSNFGIEIDFIAGNCLSTAAGSRLAAIISLCQKLLFSCALALISPLARLIRELKTALILLKLSRFSCRESKIVWAFPAA